ncbi:MAG: hypothetical protein RAP70_01465 [Candidatus Celaenobacter antarcticus]|nr:hypothetical protein [Candidatus Celaenobacter antarcticus]
MKEQIFILNKNQSLVELNESEFVTENQFQELLENYPELISGSQINPDNPRKWLLVSREIGVPNEEYGNNIWSLDHLFIDQDGIPTLVEVKRSTDTRIRREVVGQMLDYAANAITYWSINEIRDKFDKYCESNNINPEIKIQELIEDNSDIEKFWDTVATNLQAGKIRMLFVADKIPKELKRIIEFLNEQMTPAEVLGLEIKQFGNQSIKTLVPRVIGQTSSAQMKKGLKGYNQWTEETFFEELERRNGKIAGDIVRKIIVHLENKVSHFWFGKGKRSGSLVPVLDLSYTSHFPFAIWTYGKIEIYFQWYKDKPPFDSIETRKKILNKLNEIKGVNISENKINKRPSIDIKLLEEKSEYDKFIKIYDWFFNELEKNG